MIRLCGECGRGNVQTVAITVIDADAYSLIIPEVWLVVTRIREGCLLQINPDGLKLT